MKKNWFTQKDEDELAGRINGTKEDDIFHGDDWTDPEKPIPLPDVYNGRGGHDYIVGWRAADRLWGGSGNDSIYGEIGADRLFGGAGNDTLSGGGQTDLITGGSGADTFLFEAWPYDNYGSYLDIITDFDPSERGEHINLAVSADLEIATFADLRSIMFQDGDDVVMSFDGINILVLEDLQMEHLSANDFQIRFI
jgi:serralysin